MTPEPVVPKVSFFKRAAKTVVAAAGLVAVIAPVIAAGDLSTASGVVAVVLGIVTVVGVYYKANAPAA